jgi:hypothetical protein
MHVRELEEFWLLGQNAVQSDGNLATSGALLLIVSFWFLPWHVLKS